MGENEVIIARLLRAIGRAGQKCYNACTPALGGVSFGFPRPAARLAEMARLLPPLIRLLAALLGATLIITGLLAYRLGIDHNPEWGWQRIGIVALGGLSLVWALWGRLAPGLQARLARVAGRLARQPWAQAARRAAAAGAARAAGWPLARAGASAFRRLGELADAPAVRRRLFALAAALISLAALWAYLWIFSAGRMTAWPSGSRYYHLLAEAFRHGQAHLLEEPSSELLASPNPYDIRQRGQMRALWDASFYGGRYYLYWGPAPGLITVALEALLPGPVRDSFLVLGFVAGVYLASLLLLLEARRQFGGAFPGWLTLGALLAAGINAPLIWLLTRPSVYEAAIAGGQCFLLAGLYASFSAFRRTRPEAWRLLLAGLFWALAIGTRANLLAAAAFLALLTLGRLLSGLRGAARNASRPAAALLAPLLAGAAALGWYNYVRFGSVFESGHRYQLTGPALPTDYGRVFSLDYAIPNLYTAFLRPLRLEGSFPFVSVPWIKPDMWPSLVDLPPDYYYSEPVAGLLWVLPVVSLAILAGAGGLWRLLQADPRPAREAGPPERAGWSWLAACLAGAALLEAGVLLVYVASSMRYLADLAPTWIALAGLVVGRAWGASAGPPWKRAALAAAWLGAASLTAAIGLLVGVTGYHGLFEDLNPALYEQLRGLFH